MMLFFAVFVTALADVSSVGDGVDATNKDSGQEGVAVQKSDAPPLDDATQQLIQKVRSVQHKLHSQLSDVLGAARDEAVSPSRVEDVKHEDLLDDADTEEADAMIVDDGHHATDDATQESVGLRGLRLKKSIFKPLVPVGDTDVEDE